MTIEVDTGTLAAVIIAGFSGHAVVMRFAISSAISKLGEKIAEKYVTKEDLDRHVDAYHDE